MNVQAIVSTSSHSVAGLGALISLAEQMSSVCAALLAVAIILGMLACRKKIKVDREIAQRR